jgi:hypothetical protein
MVLKIVLLIVRKMAGVLIFGVEKGKILLYLDSRLPMEKLETEAEYGYMIPLQQYLTV